MFLLMGFIVGNSFLPLNMLCNATWQLFQSSDLNIHLFNVAILGSHAGEYEMLSGTVFKAK